MYRHYPTYIPTKSHYNDHMQQQNKEGWAKRAMEKNLIEHQRQSLRDKLYEWVEKKGRFTHPAVLAISEEADQLIVALQVMKQYGEHCASYEHNRSKSTV